MRRNSMMTVKKSLAVMVAAAMVMSQGVAAFAMSMDAAVTVPDGETYEKKVNEVVVDASSEYSTGVRASSKEEHDAKVTVDGKVSVEKNDGAVYGIKATSSGDKATTEVVVNENVTVNTNSNNGEATGVYAGADDGGSTSVTTGDISVSSKDGRSMGVSAGATGGGSTSVTTGDISTDSNDQSTGIQIYEYGDGSVDINVDGNIKAEGGTVIGIEAYGYSDGDNNPSLSVTVDGGIITKANESSESSFPSLTGAIILDTKGQAKVTLSGGIESDTNGIYATDNGSAKSDISISAGKDVVADDTAVEVMKGNKDSEIAVTVEGTIKGEHNLVLVESEGGVVTDGLSVTVWKIDTSSTDGRTAEVKSYNSTSESSGSSESKVTYTDYSDEAAAVINYIIKVDDTSKLSANKDTAKEGEQVFLEVNVPSGYTIDSFYTAKGGTNVDVVKDSSGKYYLVVPRGGGVFVGVSLKANSNSSNSGGDDSDSDDGNDNDNNNNANKQGGVFAGASNDLTVKVTAGQTVVVGGQEINTNVIVKDAGEAVKNTFTATLSTAALTGLFDFGGAFVAVPADTAVKESFTFTAEGLEGFVTTYLELSEYKAGDFILCSYMDASGAMVTLVVTPDMINGTTLLLTIPANCTLALAGSSV